MSKGTLTFYCGKMGAGKTTAARRLVSEKHAVLLSEDEWLASLYPHKISSLADYVEYSNLLKPQIKKLVQSILLTGTDVVMDFPANTIKQRNWFREIFSEISAPHNLIYIALTDTQCLQQIQKRRLELPERKNTDTPEMFEQVTRHFSPPETEEGFTITLQGQV